jgi:antitoxin component YwqK of YwqJK toxin-antitoxin module
MKRLLQGTIFFFCVTLNSFAQYCQFDTYNKKGSLYFFATYFESLNKPREGECLMLDGQGRVYQRRIFKNGIIQEEYTVHLESQKPYTIYKRIDQDSIIGKAQFFDVLGRLNQEVLYYRGLGNRRCWKQSEYYANGKTKHATSYVMIPLAEMLSNGYPMPPDHIIDAEGYADDIIPWGWDLEYHENGKIKSKKYRKLIIADNGSGLDQYALNGRTVEFYENGQMRLCGYYKDGNPDSLWQYYFPNGKESGVKMYRYNMGYGVWRDFHPNGITSFETYYNEDIYDPFTPHVKQFNENGVLVSEKWIDSKGKGFLREYLDNGQLIKEEIYEHGPREVAKQRKFYKNGQLQLLYYLRPINDTSMVTYYENGQVETFVSNGIHRNFQEQYFPNGNRRMRFESVNMLDNRYSSHQLYQENGRILQDVKSTQDTVIHAYYFVNGQMRQTFRREKTLLEGNFLEWDSLGRPMTQLMYHKGIRRGSGLVKKRTPRLLSEHEKTNLERWWLACLEVSHRTDSPNTEPYFLSKDSIQVYLQVLQSAMEYMPEEWKAEIPLVSSEQGRKFIYRFVLKDNPEDSLFQHWADYCKSQNWKMIKEEPLNGTWKTGEFITSDFFSPEWIKQKFMTTHPNVVLDVQIQPRWIPNGEARVLESDKRRFDGSSTVDLDITRMSNVVLLNWNTPWGVRNFTFYGDDIEPFNRFFDWDIPRSSGFELPWD